MKSNKSEMKKKGLRRYFSVSGRAPRSEMWKVTLIGSFLPIIPVILLFVLVIRFLPSSDAEKAAEFIPLISVLPFYPVFIATTIRRMHDLNWKGWWLFLIVIEFTIVGIGTKIHDVSGVFYWWMWAFVPPIVACHLLLIYGFAALLFGIGTKGPNDFGDDPLKE